MGRALQSYQLTTLLLETLSRLATPLEDGDQVLGMSTACGLNVVKVIL